MNIWDGFSLYSDFDCSVPVYRLFSRQAPVIHRFFDTSPLSPSGRYVVATEFPYEDKLPVVGDSAKVVVIDITSGKEVYSTDTKAWDTQVGAHAQWGATDNELFFNRMDIDSWVPYGVKVDIFRDNELRLESTVYFVSEDGSCVYSPSLTKISIAQSGYGVHFPKDRIVFNSGASSSDGIFISNPNTGHSALLVSIKDIYENLKDEFLDIDVNAGAFYGFHVKANRQNTRLMFILRFLADSRGGGKSKNYLVTCRTDGTELMMAVNAARWGIGHHPNWCPDGEHIIMNLTSQSSKTAFGRISRLVERVSKKVGFRYFSDHDQLKFFLVRYDGKSFQVVAPGNFGSGHPTVHPNGRYLMADAYTYERVSYSDGSVPLRLLDLNSGILASEIRVRTKPNYLGSRGEYRIDPHPAWSRCGRFLIFNAKHNAQRTVYLADFRSYLAE